MSEFVGLGPDRDVINDTLEERGLTGILMDGFDHAIEGFQVNEDGERAHIVYSYKKCIEVLIERDSMSEDEALEFFEFNTVRAVAYMPEESGRPIIIEEF
jgi:hypothetical protein